MNLKPNGALWPEKGKASVINTVQTNCTPYGVPSRSPHSQTTCNMPTIAPQLHTGVQTIAQKAHMVPTSAVFSLHRQRVLKELANRNNDVCVYNLKTKGMGNIIKSFSLCIEWLKKILLTDSTFCSIIVVPFQSFLTCALLFCIMLTFPLFFSFYSSFFLSFILYHSLINVKLS